MPLAAANSGQKLWTPAGDDWRCACCHVISEIQRMDDGVDYNALTIGDVAEPIIAVAPHQLHDIDYQFAIKRGAGEQRLCGGDRSLSRA